MVVRACWLLEQSAGPLFANPYFIAKLGSQVDCCVGGRRALAHKNMEELLRLFHHREGDFEPGVHEDDFQAFLFTRDHENTLQPIHRSGIERLVEVIRSHPSNQTAIDALAKTLSTSLEHPVYEMFLAEIGSAAVLGLFFDVSPVDMGGALRFDETKERHFRKYLLYRFASFLDLVRPGFIHWRGEPDKRAIEPIANGLDMFLRGAPKDRATLLSNWIRRLDLSTFLPKRGHVSDVARKRREALKAMGHLTAMQVATEFDRLGFTPDDYPSYHEWYLTKPSTFHAWLSRERKFADKLPT